MSSTRTVDKLNGFGAANVVFDRDHFNYTPTSSSAFLEPDYHQCDLRLENLAFSNTAEHRVPDFISDNFQVPYHHGHLAQITAFNPQIPSNTTILNSAWSTSDCFDVSGPSVGRNCEVEQGNCTLGASLWEHHVGYLQKEQLVGVPHCDNMPPYLASACIGSVPSDHAGCHSNSGYAIRAAASDSNYRRKLNGSGADTIHTVQEDLNSSTNGTTARISESDTASEKGQKAHTTIYRPACLICKKTFSRAADLQRHSYKHNKGEPMYQCGVEGCG